MPYLATTASSGADTTKSKRWGLASSQFSDAWLIIFEEPFLQVPQDMNAGEDIRTGNWTYGTWGAWGIGTLSGAWIVASTGDGTA